VRLCTSDALVVLSVCVSALLIMVNSGRWLYLVVTFIEVKTIVVVASLRAKTGINAIFPLSKKSVLNLAIFPYYSNLLLRRRRWTGILRRGVLGYVLPRLSFLWCYGVFRCSVLLRVVIVFRDIIYVIIILYS
jgi:hypothetical protein